MHILDFHTIFWRIAVTSACGNVGTFCMIFQYTIGTYSQVLVSNQATSHHAPRPRSMARCVHAEYSAAYSSIAACIIYRTPQRVGHPKLLLLLHGLRQRLRFRLLQLRRKLLPLLPSTYSSSSLPPPPSPPPRSTPQLDLSIACRSCSNTV